MDKARPNFTDDLNAIQGEVAADVGTILELAKQSRIKDYPPTSAEPSQPRENRRPRQSPPRRQAAPQPVPEQTPRVLENVTTRLSRETNALLTEAALHQRLKKVTPATRQDILETAVREWLRREGYLKGHG